MVAYLRKIPITTTSLSVGEVVIEGSEGCVVWLNQSFLFLLCVPKTLPTPTALVGLWTRQKNRTVNGIVLGATAL